jgi:lipopolysaccharide export system permease protein
MRILDKYILKEFLAPFLFGVAAFTAIFLGADTLLKIASYVTRYGATVTAAFKIFVLALPRIIVYTFPMAVLLGALMCFSKLSSLSELIVMRTSGQSFIRLAMPVFILAFFISLGAVAFNEYVVPWTNQEYQRVLNNEIMKNMNPGVTNHVVIKDVQHGKIAHLLYARKYDPNTKELKNLTVQEFENEQVVRVENAPQATWSNGSWHMENGVIYDLNDDGVDHMMHFDTQEIPYAQKPDEIQKENKDLDEMTIRDLLVTAKAYQAAHADTTPIYMELNRRFSLPFASFVFALLGAPLGVQRQRSSSSLGFGLSVVIIFLYYAIMTFLEALGKGHVIAPALAVWLPNIIAFATAVAIIRKVNR